MYPEEFSKRMIELRMQKGVSARSMSLSIGQSENYINGIENGHGYPKMEPFFEICHFFGITPMEFFDTDCPSPTKARELYGIAKSLSREQLEQLIAIAKTFAKL